MIERLQINFKKIDKNAKTPEQAHLSDAGFDLEAISINETDKFIEYGTGIAIEIPYGYAGFLYSRSSVTKKDLMLKNSVGIIDSGYRGEIKFRFNKTIVKEREVQGSVEGSVLNYLQPSEREQYKIGDKIGQIIIQKIPQVTFNEVEELNDSERGSGGFGSTGN